MISRPKSATSLLYSDRHLKNLIRISNQQKNLLETIRQILPSPLATHCLAASHAEQCLTLFTDSSAWASRLRFYSRDLCQRLSDSSVPTQKTDVRVIPKSAKAASQVTRPEKQVKLSAAAAKNILQTAEAIDDADLRRALQKLGKLGIG